MSFQVQTTTAALIVMKQEGSIDQIDLTEKKEFICSKNGATIYLALTNDPTEKNMTARDFNRGYTIVERIDIRNVRQYLAELGIDASTRWWSQEKPEWQYQTEQDEVYAAHSLTRSNRISRQSRVYFIYNPERNMIKIGWTRSIDSRFSTLQNASPDKLELLGHIEGNRDMESQFHERFSEHRCSGEWFNYADEVREAIEELLQDDIGT